jgi:hypothetical protein
MTMKRILVKKQKKKSMLLLDSKMSFIENHYKLHSNMQVLIDGYNSIVTCGFSVRSSVGWEDGRLASSVQRGSPTVANIWSLKNRTLQGVTAKHKYGVTQRVTEFWQSKTFTSSRLTDFIFYESLVRI